MWHNSWNQFAYAMKPAENMTKKNDLEVQNTQKQEKQNNKTILI